MHQNIKYHAKNKLVLIVKEDNRESSEMNALVYEGYILSFHQSVFRVTSTMSTIDLLSLISANNEFLHDFSLTLYFDKIKKKRVIMTFIQKQKPISLSNALDSSSLSFTILPSPFQTVLIISAEQLQQASQRVTEIDNEVRNAEIKRTLIQEISKQQKAEYSNIMADLIPLYAKINHLIPLHFIITKNSDIAARKLLTMKYLIQQQFIALPDEHYFLNLDELQKHKELLQELEKYEPAIEKLDKSGGYAALNIQFNSKKEETTLDNFEQNIEDDASNNVPTLPPLRSGSSALAKFLSLIEDDTFDELTNRVGDLAIPAKNIKNI
ncbi:24350_t:CDS:2 [Dentiscutata erythropus]|uniref:24350_t:CDS:1 n=1 Tax=Dentiscutata erythropus TaxID=1348616 RepID=A0A9N9ITZ9_9GLOM|nr:24350_t:CDS:2 [Dentiscutata erythropus]